MIRSPNFSLAGVQTLESKALALAETLESKALALAVVQTNVWQSSKFGSAKLKRGLLPLYRTKVCNRFMVGSIS